MGPAENKKRKVEEDDSSPQKKKKQDSDSDAEAPTEAPTYKEWRKMTITVLEEVAKKLSKSKLWKKVSSAASSADEAAWWSAVAEHKKFTIKSKDDGRQFVSLA